jgi:hypothetical protein
MPSYQRAMLAAGEAILRVVCLCLLARCTRMEATRERVRRDDPREEMDHCAPILRSSST